mmetsp:Transcript_21219/g.33941  ORF Transcript_21219/g.33941 Transcript_21219/m.33941 type:complete len:326 (-) Transcript_21219:110-1087(-)|eukprot:CAMPEP_0179419516 /NCGR_PEP_ID=MMETSP0799-20121207/8642_1 /TAXON_ID=46947 /ORGANISM="Geminigera cryophila, Strain CCMP2564" /LENGTH=325 /DNA_ID=CAMNT_0021192997 /DNA_START=70 /DNA_END=1047 /DNA_ORIENTATION=-
MSGAAGGSPSGPAVELLRVAENRTEMPFAKYIEEESPKFAKDARYSKGLVRYKDLKDHIKNMQKSKYERDMMARRNKHLTDECAICLEPLGPASDVTTTACKHSFHTFCLVETLGNGMCTSCPLCRTEVEKLVPGGLDGQSLKLIAKLRINIDAAQWCHKAIFDELASKAAHCQHDIQSLWIRRYMPFTGSKKKKIRQRLQSLLVQLDVLQSFSRVNVQGFSRICGKIDRKMSSGLSKLILSNYVHNMGYCKDFAEDGNGLTMALAAELKRMVEMMGGTPDDIDVNPGCSGLGLWSKKDSVPAPPQQQQRAGEANSFLNISGPPP